MYGCVKTSLDASLALAYHLFESGTWDLDIRVWDRCVRTPLNASAEIASARHMVSIEVIIPVLRVQGLGFWVEGYNSSSDGSGFM